MVLIVVLTVNSTLPLMSGTKSTASPSAVVVSSTSGLQLSVSVNSTTVPFEGSVLVSADVRNTLPSANNVTASSDWPLLGLNAASPNEICPHRDDVGIVIFPGSLTAQNVSGLTGEPLYHEVGASCPPSPANFPQYSYLFGPSSDNATVAYGCDPGAPSNDNNTTCGCSLSRQCPDLSTRSAETNVTFAVRGFWGAPDLRIFAPGEYTLAAGDEWGAIAITHFVVSDPGCNVIQGSLAYPIYEGRQLGTPNTPGAWAFTAQLSSAVATQGQNATLSASLVNMALGSQTVGLVNPLLSGLRVLRSDGSLAWEYTPPSMTAQQSIDSGGQTMGAVTIPTSQLQAGRTYTVVASPGLYDQDRPLGLNLTVSVPLLVC